MTARAKGPKGKQGSQITSKLSAYMYFCFSFFHASKPTDNNEDRLLVPWIEVVCDCRRILSMLACVTLSDNAFQSSLSSVYGTSYCMKRLEIFLNWANKCCEISDILMVFDLWLIFVD